MKDDWTKDKRNFPLGGADLPEERVLVWIWPVVAMVLVVMLWAWAIFGCATNNYKLEPQTEYYSYGNLTP